MSSATLAPGVARWPWRLWQRQAIAVMRADLKKSALARRGLWIYFLAFAPVAIIGLHALVSAQRALDAAASASHMAADTEALAAIFQFYYLRMAIFFGCMGIFTWLFRGEFVERTLHYYLLLPVRREVLVIGKFAAGLVTSIVLFGSAVFLSFVLMYSHLGVTAQQYVFDGPGLSQLGSYLLVTALACVGYGALFLLLSLFLRNPIVPGVLLLGWEGISPVLPQALQKFTVIFYLKHLSPVPVRAEGLLALFTVVAEPVPAWMAVAGLVTLSACAVALACLRARSLQVTYHAE